MKKIETIYSKTFGSQIYKIGYGIAIVILSFFTSFLLVGTASTENFEKGENYYIFIFLALFVFSQFINITFDENAKELKWRIILQ
ncbi:MAG: hypothetical protein WBC91_14510, partial [Phototrophicaceae bacterium]